MIRLFLCCLFVELFNTNSGQDFTCQTNNLKNERLIMPAIEKYYMALAQNTSIEISYKIASTYAFFYTVQARDSTFIYLNSSLKKDATLIVPYATDYLR